MLNLGLNLRPPECLNINYQGSKHSGVPNGMRPILVFVYITHYLLFWNETLSSQLFSNKFDKKLLSI